MDNFDEILGQLQDSSGELKDNYHILEEIVPIEEQMRYFEYSKRIRIGHDYVDRNYLVATLFTPTISVEQKRYCLSMLAGLPDVGAYRSIETYHSSPSEPELSNWSALALLESRLLLDSDLSGEKQVLVSTGLGGHNGKLRFFAIIAIKNRENFKEWQQEILDHELKFRFEREHIIVEEYNFKSNYLEVLLLSGLNSDLRGLFADVVNECNQFGDFVDDKFLITNLKRFTKKEIEHLLEKKD